MGLKAEREKRNFSQSELSKLSGVNVRMIQDYEQGRKDIIAPFNNFLVLVNLFSHYLIPLLLLAKNIIPLLGGCCPLFFYSPSIISSSFCFFSSSV